MVTTGYYAWRSRLPSARAVADDANEVFVEVQDTGPGYDPADIDRLFESFYTTKPAGIGMGLAISRSIVEAHGGRLWGDVQRAPGRCLFVEAAGRRPEVAGPGVLAYLAVNT